METLEVIRRKRERERQDVHKYNPAVGSFIKVQPTKNGKFQIVDVVATEKNAQHIASVLKTIMSNPDEFPLDENVVKLLMHEGLFEQIVVQDKPFRTPDQAQKHSVEVKEVVKELFTRYGLVFRGEKAGDSSIREHAADFIAKDFMFDGSGPDGEIRFRRVVNGVLGKPFSAEELVNYYFNPNTSPVIDNDRTRQNHEKAINEYKEAKLGGKKRNEMTQEEIREFDKVMGKAFNEALRITRRMYSTKTLPAYNETELRYRFEDEATTRHGLPKKDLSKKHQYDKHELYKIERHVSENMEKVTSLHSYDELKPLFSMEVKKESWDGITSE